MSFHQHSKQIVEEYLGTVAYVDDLIFSTKKIIEAVNIGKTDIRIASAENTVKERVEIEKAQQLIPNINPLNFTNSFLKKGIHCALLEITKEEDSLEPIKKVLKKSDVVILDWQMHQDLGRKATELLVSVLHESKNPGLRLIIIFTNDPNFNTILNGKIIPKLNQIGISDVKIDDSGCNAIFGHTKIVVLVKENGHKTENSVSDEELPDRITDEFVTLTGGLVSNTILKSISTIRKNTHKLLQLYNNQLDSAFILTRALSSDPEDSATLLRDAIICSISSILTYENITSSCDIETIKKWIDDNSYPNKEISIKKASNKIPISDTDRKEWLEIGYKKFINTVLERNGKEPLSIEHLEDYDRNGLLKDAIDCFITPKALHSSEDFAILTHHKSNFMSPSSKPLLTLGTVIQRFNQYFLCIQQKCDSLRIEKNSCRSFLFLPMEETTKGFSVIVKDNEHNYTKLKVKNKNCHNLITIDFFETGSGTVMAKKSWEYFRFYDTHKRSYKWILDLNDSQAQKIVNEYSANLSRVAIDESEWLRRS